MPFNMTKLLEPEIELFRIKIYNLKLYKLIVLNIYTIKIIKIKSFDFNFKSQFFCQFLTTNRVVIGTRKKLHLVRKYFPCSYL